MSKTRNATIANLTFVLGQLEEIKSNINDTMRYVKQNPESWDTNEEAADSKEESAKEKKETAQ